MRPSITHFKTGKRDGFMIRLNPKQAQSLVVSLVQQILDGFPNGARLEMENVDYQPPRGEKREGVYLSVAVHDEPAQEIHFDLRAFEVSGPDGLFVGNWETLKRAKLPMRLARQHFESLKPGEHRTLGTAKHPYALRRVV